LPQCREHKQRHTDDPLLWQSYFICLHGILPFCQALDMSGAVSE